MAQPKYLHRSGAQPWCTKRTPSSGIRLQHTHFLLFFTSFWHYFVALGNPCSGVAGDSTSPWDLPGRGHWYGARKLCMAPSHSGALQKCITRLHGCLDMDGGLDGMFSVSEL